MINTVRYHICKVKTHKAVPNIVSGTYVVGQWLFLEKKRQEWDREALFIICEVFFKHNLSYNLHTIQFTHLKCVLCISECSHDHSQF